MEGKRKDIAFIHTSSALKKIAEVEDKKSKYEVRLIEQLMLLQATIVGFSAAFLSINSTIPSSGSNLIEISISMMLVNVVLGALVIRGEADQKSHANFTWSIFKANQDALDEMVSQGLISKNSDEYQGLVVANLVEYTSKHPHLEDQQVFSQYAHDLTKQWKPKLPHTVLIEDKKDQTLADLRNPAYLWFISKTPLFKAWFFVITPLSFALLIISLFKR